MRTTKNVMLSKTIWLAITAFLVLMPAHSPLAATEDGEKNCFDFDAGMAVEGIAPIQLICRAGRPVAEQVKTVAGILRITGKKDTHDEDSLSLGGKDLARGKTVFFEQGFPEKKRLPSFFILNISSTPGTPSSSGDRSTDSKYCCRNLHIVDVGVSPPFISEENIGIRGVRNREGSRDLVEIKKIDKDTYIISGETLPEETGVPVKQSVKYDRKTRAITRIGPPIILDKEKIRSIEEAELLKDMGGDCNDGQAAEGSVPIQWFCHPTTSVDERVKTVAGMLSVQGGSRTLWLDEKKLARAEWLILEQGFPEKNGLPSLFVVNISPIPYSTDIEAADTGNRFNHLYLHIVDVGVTPPFISKERLPIAGVRNKSGNRGILSIKKVDEDTYILSGETLPEKGESSKPTKLSVQYSRKDGIVTRIK